MAERGLDQVDGRAALEGMRCVGVAESAMSRWRISVRRPKARCRTHKP